MALTNKTLSTLAGRVQRRLPNGLDTNMIIDTINELYAQNTLRALKWHLVTTHIHVVKQAAEKDGITCVLPDDFNPAHPAYLSGDPALGYALEIPHIPPEKFFKHQTYVNTPVVGQYSAWTYRASGDGTYTAYLVPYAAGALTPGHELPFVYHKLFTDRTSGQTLPWPAEFDPLMIDLVEAELCRINRWSAWELPLKKAMEQIQLVVEGSLTTKQVMAGLAAESRKAAEIQAETRPR